MGSLRMRARGLGAVIGRCASSSRGTGLVTCAQLVYGGGEDAWECLPNANLGLHESVR